MPKCLHHSWVKTCRRCPKLHAQQTSRQTLLVQWHGAFKIVIATELRSKELGTSDTKKTNEELPIEVALAELEAVMSRNGKDENEKCKLVPLPDRLRGPAHVAEKLMDEAGKNWNDEQKNP